MSRPARFSGTISRYVSSAATPRCSRTPVLCSNGSNGSCLTADAAPNAHTAVLAKYCCPPSVRKRDFSKHGSAAAVCTVALQTQNKTKRHFKHETREKGPFNQETKEKGDGQKDPHHHVAVVPRGAQQTKRGKEMLPTPRMCKPRRSTPRVSLSASGQFAADNESRSPRPPPPLQTPSMRNLL